ncbi:MAG: M14 family zinc carboxypeptidase [Phycisphaerales bacterium]
MAGLDGTHLLGPEIAWRVAERIAKEHGELLEGRALLIVPQVNPDAAARTLASPGNPFSRTPRAVDDDRDGRADEDGPEDLDGDGVVTLMRVANPAPPAVATLVADPAEPRLLRTADPVKGERPLYRLLVEGIDNDGDGLINEDAPGGVDLDRNFMHRWPEFEDGAGPYPLSEPESLALARFVIGHPEIALGLTYGRHDNLVKLPRADATDVNPQIPLELDAADLPLHTELARIFKESTGQTRAPSMNSAGSFEAWLYAQRGVPSLATVVWGRPDPKPETKPEAKPETKPETKPDGKPDPAAETKPTDAPQAAAAPGATSAPVAPPAQPPAAPPPAAGGATPPGVPGGPPGGGGRRQGRGGGGGPGGGFGGPPGARTARPVTTDAPVGDVAEETAWLKYSDSERDGSGFVA